MTRLSERIADRLKAARKDAGLTQQKLADLAGVSIVHVSRLERAQADQPRRTELESVAAALGLTADDLMGMAEDESTVDPAEETDEQIDAELDELTSDADLLVAFMGRVRDPKKLPRALKLTIRDDLKRLRARHRQQG